MIEKLDTQSLVNQFTRIGAKLRIEHPRRRVTRTYNLDVVTTREHGEHFVLTVTPNTPPMRVLQANRAARHLLLLVNGRRPPHIAGRPQDERFLCGHDERHWFAAAIEGRVSTITEAKRVLLPDALRDAGLAPADLARRHNHIFVRQGEWFFVPVTDETLLTQLAKLPIHISEPLVRARGSKPHLVQELVRFGGTSVVVSGTKEYDPEVWGAMVAAGTVKSYQGRMFVKDAEVYARGKVRHPDHATLDLPGWHRVYPNKEARSVNLSFYD